HGGLPDQEEARRQLDAYLPVLHQVLDAFNFLGDTALKVCHDESTALVTGRARVRTLRGAAPSGPALEDLSEDEAAAFAESRAVLVAPAGMVVPLYPLFNPVSEQEPLSLYDGHYGIRVQTQQTAEERGYV